MIARYAGGTSGARRAARAGAAVVVVDAFRASATIAALVLSGARVVPFASIEEAAGHPADLRVGERGGEQVPGFDFGNSPTAILQGNVPKGSTVSMSTTNGTRIVEAAAGSPAILAGCFVNAGSVADALFELKVEEVVAVGCGWRGRRSSEDEAASAEILSRLEDLGAVLDERARRVVEGLRRRSPDALAKNTAATLLKGLGYERDVELCLIRDSIPAAPILFEGAFVSY